MFGTVTTTIVGVAYNLLFHSRHNGTDKTNKVSHGINMVHTQVMLIVTASVCLCLCFALTQKNCDVSSKQ